MSILYKPATFSFLQCLARCSTPSKYKNPLRYCCIIDNFNTKVDIRLFCDKSDNGHPSSDEKTDKSVNKIELTGTSLSTRFDIFKESDAPILLDVYEEKMHLEKEALYRPVIDQDESEFQGLNLQRKFSNLFMQFNLNCIKLALHLFHIATSFGNQSTINKQNSIIVPYRTLTF